MNKNEIIELDDNSLNSIIKLIETHRQNAYRKVNEELVSLYYEIGEFLSTKIASEKWGSKAIDRLAKEIKKKYPTLKGFANRNLYRMIQFYEAYRHNIIVSTLLTQISWSNNMLILSSTKTMEEKEFYIRMCIKNNYSERDLRKAIVHNLKDFILEIGKDFSFIGEEYRIQVGNRDFYIDLLFYNRAQSCLVAFELKIDEFQPEYVSKMDFYLEALDRQERKDGENPSIGIILCSNKDKTIVEYATSRSVSPLTISKFQTNIIDKELLQSKLIEFRKHYEEKK